MQTSRPSSFLTLGTSDDFLFNYLIIQGWVFTVLNNHYSRCTLVKFFLLHDFYLGYKKKKKEDPFFYRLNIVYAVQKIVSCVNYNNKSK